MRVVTLKFVQFCVDGQNICANSFYLRFGHWHFLLSGLHEIEFFFCGRRLYIQKNRLGLRDTVLLTFRIKIGQGKFWQGSTTSFQRHQSKLENLFSSDLIVVNSLFEFGLIRIDFKLVF